MTYTELLQQKEWWSKCNEILQRDHFTCKDCGSVGFHNGGSFIKLDRIEEMDSILKGWLIGNLAICDRCGGSGYLPQYSHVEDGVCFKCGGEGVVLNESF